MKKMLPIGVSSFDEIIIGDYYYIDKSLLIRELLDLGAKVTLIPRPRRFGKTLNLSMVRCFFEKTEQSRAHLFHHLKVANYSSVMAHQGKYPVIFLTFKDIKQTNWKHCYKHLQVCIGAEFKRHSYLLASDKLDDAEKAKFLAVINTVADITAFEHALNDLAGLLHRYHGVRPIILIDEYDTPIHSGFTHRYYDAIITFMRVLLGIGLKDNEHIKFAVLTGILRVAKESVFSGLNNLQVCTILDEWYDDKFGLTEGEVEALVAYYEIATSMDAIRRWYNGYTSGLCRVYNPWSIVDFASKKGRLQAYWINTSSNDLIKELIQRGGQALKKEMEALLAGDAITKKIEENIVFQSVYSNDNVVWNFLLFTGYLTYKNLRLDGVHQCADLLIPNDEIRSFYESTIFSWFEASIGQSSYQLLLKSLLTGDIETFEDILRDCIEKSLSMFDVSGVEPERFYHALVLGMLISLRDTYEVKSNRESGYGRYDVMLIPRDTSNKGVIIEFKKVVTARQETLASAANRALQQIEQQQYARELEERGVKAIIKLGVACEGKKILVVQG